MTGTARTSLAEFAETARVSRCSCWGCRTLPPEVLDEVVKGAAAGINKSVITQWLNNEGYPCTKPTVVYTLGKHGE